MASSHKSCPRQISAQTSRRLRGSNGAGTLTRRAARRRRVGDGSFGRGSGLEASRQAGRWAGRSAPVPAWLAKRAAGRAAPGGTREAKGNRRQSPAQHAKPGPSASGVREATSWSSQAVSPPTAPAGSAPAPCRAGQRLGRRPNMVRGAAKNRCEIRVDRIKSASTRRSDPGQPRQREDSASADRHEPAEPDRHGEQQSQRIILSHKAADQRPRAPGHECERGDVSSTHAGAPSERDAFNVVHA